MGEHMKKTSKKTECALSPNDFDRYQILSADLSLRRPGFCIVKIDKINEKIQIVDVQLFSVDNKTKNKPRGEMLHENAEKLRELLALTGEPMFLVREKSINNCNLKMRRSGSAAKSGVSETVGIADLLAWEIQKKEWDEIYPVTIKKLVTGSGKSEKTMVAKYLPAYYGQNLSFRNDDESDAAAVAIAWLIQNHQIKQIVQEDIAHESPQTSEKI